MKSEFAILTKAELKSATVRWANLSDDAKRTAMGKSRHVQAWVVLDPENVRFETCGLVRFTLLAVTVRLPDGKTYRYSNTLRKWALK